MMNPPATDALFWPTPLMGSPTTTGRPRPTTDGADAPSAACAVYGAYAAAYLALTVLAGTWLRGAALAPTLLVGLSYRHAVHAHSHLAFFGWTTMALFAVLARTAERDAGGVGGRRSWRWWHAHAVGVASGAAFVGFLLRGYTAATIALATLHVALWFAFAVPAWDTVATAAPASRRLYRAALAFLMVAGAGAMTPGLLAARGVTDPWLTRAAVELFLTPFSGGWLVLGAAGAAYAHIERPRFDRAALVLLVVGTVPSLALHVPGPAPLPWLVPVGRLGAAMVGAGTLLLGADLLRGVVRGANAPLLRVAALSALGAGVVQLAVASGAALHLIASRQAAVAYLHLLLLGVVTPSLAAVALVPRATPRLACVHAAGLLATLASVGALGVPALSALAARLHVSAGALLGVALAGGALSAAAMLALAAVHAGDLTTSPRHALHVTAGGAGVRRARARPAAAVGRRLRPPAVPRDLGDDAGVRPRVRALPSERHPVA